MSKYADLELYTLTTYTGTAYNVVLSDQFRLVTLNNALSITVTIPTNASVAFPVGSKIDFVQLGVGQVSFMSSATLRYTPGPKLRAQYSAATAIKIATDEWVIIGDLAA